MTTGWMALAAAAVLAAPEAPEGTTLDLAGEDLQGRNIDGRDFRGKVLLLAVATDETSDAVLEWQVRLGYEASVTLGGGEGVAVVSVADVSDYPWIARPFVRRRLRAVDRAARERLLERFAAEGREPRRELLDRVWLLPDWNGAVSRALVAAAERGRPHLFLVDPAEAIRGHFTENSEATRREAAAILAALIAPGAAGEASR